jgi:hypothetical protein
VWYTVPVRVLVSFLSLTINIENARINTFIYDGVVGGENGRSLCPIEKRVQLDNSDPNHDGVAI